MTKKQVKTEKKKISGYIFMGFIFLIVISAIIFGPKVYQKVNIGKENEIKKIEKLEKENINLEVEKDTEFENNGFSKKYYELDNKIDKNKNKITAAEANITFKYTFLPIIITTALVAFVLFGIVFNIMVSDMKKMTPKLNKLGKTFGVNQQVSEQQKAIFDLLNRRLEQEELKNTKLKPLKCPSCKANIEHNAKKCDYCGTSLIREKK